VLWVLKRASGVCEACGLEGPFKTGVGVPFLEVHHVVPLAEGGSDTVNNAVALCPNCHRALHLALDRKERQHQIRERVARREGVLLLTSEGLSPKPTQETINAKSES
jgi:5-methylcytosine-specific restriction protein A